MTAQTIPELTRYEYNELYYNSADTAITGNFVLEICDLLDRCGIDIQPTNTYDETVANAVIEFQTKIEMLNPNGILTTSTLQSMILYADNLNSETIEGEEGETTTIFAEALSESPHYNSFFDGDKYKMHRRNHKDIKIVFGNKSITKTIKDIFMRSVTVEVDTSGNPISEIYEFVARDIKESDEISDINKYNNEFSAPVDIERDYSFIGLNNKKENKDMNDYINSQTNKG